MTEPQLVRIRTFMAMFDRPSISEVQREAKAGRIPGAQKVGGRWLFDPAAYKATVMGQTDPEPGAPMTSRRGQKRGNR